MRIISLGGCCPMECPVLPTPGFVKISLSWDVVLHTEESVYCEHSNLSVFNFFGVNQR